MMFRRFLCLAVVALLLSSSAFATQLIWYQGNVRPDAPDSCGSGMSWSRFSGVDEGSLVNDPDATDGLAWRIVDTNSAKDQWRTSSDNIAGAVGATIVARVKVISESSGGGNIGFLEGGGLSSEYHWGGPTGHIKEARRSSDGYGETYLTSGNDSNYHILRMTAIGTGQSNRVFTFYFDENPTPVLTVSQAINISDSVDAFTFGATSTAGSQDVYFDWITGYNAGVFAPGEEVAVIGKSLVIAAVPEPSSMMALAGGLAAIAGAAFRRRK